MLPTTDASSLAYDLYCAYNRHMDRKALILDHIPKHCAWREQTAELLLFLINPEHTVYIRIPSKQRVMNFLRVYVPELEQEPFAKAALEDTLDHFYAFGAARGFFNANRLCYSLENEAQRTYRMAKYAQYNKQRYDMEGSHRIYQQAQTMRHAVKAPQQNKRDYLKNTELRAYFGRVFAMSIGLTA